MRSSRRIELSPEADSDLQALLDYSLGTWGERQQNLYASRMSGAIQELVTYPEIGAVRDDISPGLRSRRAGQHVIYYRVLETSIRIVRILHARMNPALHFRESP